MISIPCSITRLRDNSSTPTTKGYIIQIQEVDHLLAFMQSYSIINHIVHINEYNYTYIYTFIFCYIYM